MGGGDCAPGAMARKNSLIIMTKTIQKHWGNCFSGAITQENNVRAV